MMLLFVHILKLVMPKQMYYIYICMIPLIYLPPNEPNILLQKPIKNLKIDDCWLIKGSKGYIETELGESVEVHHFEYYNFNQIELSDSTPKITTVEAITNNNTLLQLGIFNAFGNVTQRIENETHTVISCLIQPMLQNHGKPIFTTLCHFQLFGEEEKEASVS
uniref:SUN domain-containing protein n=1 Tax=Panagrolaimus sp. PS1159 TaxID=55785 RepID=A0AC35GWW7_9BILA